ncbi:MAG: LLM class F420-dependent oxidoreductase [Hyphomicrobiales bacterium]
MALKLGLGFFVTGFTVDPITLAKAVEAAGFESLWVPDHPVFPVTPRTPYSLRDDGCYPRVFGEMADPFVVLSYAAAATTTLRLGTAVALVTQRHPLTLAKTVATLDNFSGGRLLFGVGTGNLPEDLEMYGVRFDKRRAYASEAVEAMKRLWRDGRAAYSGRYVSFPEVRCDPLPGQRPNPPVLVGAPLNKWTVERAARWGDGWLPPSGTSPQDIERGRKQIEARCREYGRDPAGLDITAFFVMDVTPATQRAYEEAGATRIVAQLYNHPGAPVPMERWRDGRIASLGGPDAAPPSPRETLAALERLTELAGL